MGPSALGPKGLYMGVDGSYSNTPKSVSNSNMNYESQIAKVLYMNNCSYSLLNDKSSMINHEAMEMMSSQDKSMLRERNESVTKSSLS